MRNRYTPGVLAALVSLLVSSSLCAGEYTPPGANCLETLTYRVVRGQWVRVFTYDGIKHEGRYAAVNPERSILTLSSLDSTLTPALSWDIDDVAKIQYRKTGIVKKKYVVVGGFLGGAVGGLAGAFIAPCGDIQCEGMLCGLDECMTRKIMGAVVGGVVGIVAGSAWGKWMSRHSTSTYTVRCE